MKSPPPLIVETDLGGDPDDLFALLWLFSLGIDIPAIVISPGYKHQCALARFIVSTLDKKTHIGSARPGERKGELSGFYKILLQHHGRALEDESDGPGGEIILKALQEHFECAFLGIGPLSNLRQAWDCNNPVLRKGIVRATMQGGFLPYSLYRPSVTLSKFEGKNSVPTFNLNGDLKGADIFVNGLTCSRRFVSKNVCHTIVYDRNVHEFMVNIETANPAHQLLIEALDLYMQRHKEKKFHDPLAAACHLFPEIATWYNGVPQYSGGGWTVLPAETDKVQIIADVDRDRFWDVMLAPV